MSEIAPAHHGTPPTLTKMRYPLQLLPNLLLLLTILQTVLCQSPEDFWEGLENLVEQHEIEAISKFVKTGHLPSERVPVVQHVAVQEEAPAAQVRSAGQRYEPRPEDLQQRLPASRELDAAREPVVAVHQQPLSHPPVVGSDAPGASQPKTQGYIQQPTTLTLEERRQILEQVSKRFPGILHPYKGQVLTPDLIGESFGIKTMQLRQFDPDTYVSFARLSKTPTASFHDGGMELTQPNEHHMYVWKYSQPPNGNSGSIFQLVGAVETKRRKAHIANKMQLYSVGRRIEVLGPDSIHDKTLLIPNKRKRT